MKRHTVDETSFELPAGWNLVAIVEGPAVKGETFRSNLVISRDRLRPEETVRTYLDRQFVELARKLKRFVLRGRREVKLGDVDGHEIRCTWQGAQGPIEQTLTMVARKDHILTFTVSIAKGRVEEVMPQFEELFKSMVWTDPPA
jgi:hypothetical protein